MDRTHDSSSCLTLLFSLDSTTYPFLACFSLLTHPFHMQQQQIQWQHLGVENRWWNR